MNKEEKLPVVVYRWAKKSSQVYLQFGDDGNVEFVHIGKPSKKRDPLYRASFVRVEDEDGTKRIHKTKKYVVRFEYDATTGEVRALVA